MDAINNLDDTKIVGYPDTTSDDQLSDIVVESISSFHSDSLEWSDLNKSLWPITQETELLEQLFEEEKARLSNSAAPAKLLFSLMPDQPFKDERAKKPQQHRRLIYTMCYQNSPSSYSEFMNWILAQTSRKWEIDM